MAGLQSYSPGIWINWKEKAVELDARVVLRRGMLELLACSPNTREHESILVVPGRPRDIYHALGLIGLSPGSPVRYDEKAEAWRAPTGQSLHLEVRFSQDGARRTLPAVAWLRSAQTGAPPNRVNWVFAGSTTWVDGRFGGDAEGTVVALVDFESAVVAVGGLHTADNDALWLEANPENVPPVGTSCRLVITARERTLGFTLSKEGELRLGETVLPPTEVARRYRTRASRGWDASIRIVPAVSLTVQAREAVLLSLVRAGIPRSRIQIDREGKDHRNPDENRGSKPGG